MYKKGTVVLVPFPFTDLSGSKVRPAVIVSDGKIGSDVVLLFITSQVNSKGRHIVRVVPDQENGIKTKSKIVCSKIATLEAKIILGELGSLSQTVQKSIDTELRKVLGL
jgi:mRNA interferase MazF